MNLIIILLVVTIIVFWMMKKETSSQKDIIVIRAVNQDDPRVKNTLSKTSAESYVILDVTRSNVQNNSYSFIHSEDSCREANPLHKDIKYSVDSVIWHIYEQVKDKDFKYIWILEDDVYCDGSLDIVLEKNSSKTEDFLASFVEDYGASENEINWMWWNALEGVAIPDLSQRVKSFFPVTRYSKEFLKEIHDSIGIYSGYCEVYIPTLAKQNGYTYGNLEKSSVGNLSLSHIVTLPQNEDGRLYHKWMIK